MFSWADKTNVKGGKKYNKKIVMGQKYSDWFKIDLHIHTDKSKETKEGDYKGVFSVDTLKTKLKENGVRIFSLTDHNIVNVDAYRE